MDAVDEAWSATGEGENKKFYYENGELTKTETSNCPPGFRCETDKDGHTRVYNDEGNVIGVIPAKSQSEVTRDAIVDFGYFLKDTGEDVAIETAMMFVGGKIVKFVWKGGKWVVKSIKYKKAIEEAISKSLKASKYVTEDLAGFWIRGQTTIANGIYTLPVAETTLRNCDISQAVTRCSLQLHLYISLW